MHCANLYCTAGICDVSLSNFINNIKSKQKLNHKHLECDTNKLYHKNIYISISIFVGVFMSNQLLTLCENVMKACQNYDIDMLV